MPDELTSLVIDALRRRRESLGTSQADVAWLARVSRTTISNLERQYGEPENRTIESAANALGMFYEEDDAGNLSVREAVDEGATRRVLQIITSLRKSGRDKDFRLARNAADAFIEFVAGIHSNTDDDSLWARRSVSRLLDFLGPHLDVESVIDQPILALAEQWKAGTSYPAFGQGRSPAVSPATSVRETVAGSPADVGVQLEIARERLASLHVELANARKQIGSLEAQVRFYEDRVQAFMQLPGDVQELLRRASGVSVSTTKSDPAGLNIVCLVIPDRTARSAGELVLASYRWQSALSVAVRLFDQMAERHPPKQIQEMLRLLDKHHVQISAFHDEAGAQEAANQVAGQLSRIAERSMQSDNEN